MATSGASAVASVMAIPSPTTAILWARDHGGWLFIPDSVLQHFQSEGARFSAGDDQPDIIWFDAACYTMSKIMLSHHTSGSGYIVGWQEAAERLGIEV